MTGFTAMLACLALALASLVLADLSSMTAEVRARLLTTEHAFEALVAEVQTKGPEFAKCVTGVADYDKSIATAHLAIDACQTTAADALATPLCLTKDVACLKQIDAFKLTTLTNAGSCMLLAVRDVDAVVARLTKDIVECDRLEGEHLTQGHSRVPAGRRPKRRVRWKKVVSKGWEGVKKVIPRVPRPYSPGPRPLICRPVGMVPCRCSMLPCPPCSMRPCPFCGKHLCPPYPYGR